MKPTAEFGFQSQLEADEQKEKIEQEILQSEFNQVLKDKFRLIPNGSTFFSKLEGVKDIRIFTPRDKENPENAYIMPFYDGENRNGKTIEKHTTFTINNEGGILGEVPEELKHLTRNQIIKEALDDLTSIGLKILDKRTIFLDDDLEVIPPGDWPMAKRIKQGEHKSRVPLDPDRYQFFTQQQDLLYVVHPGKLTRINYGAGDRFGTGSKIADLSDYHSFIFPKGVIFENEVCENNLFYYQYDNELSKEIIQKIKDEGLSQDEQKQLLDTIGFHVERVKDKSTLQLEGKRYDRKHADHNDSPQVKQIFYSQLQSFINSNFI